MVTINFGVQAMTNIFFCEFPSRYRIRLRRHIMSKQPQADKCSKLYLLAKKLDNVAKNPLHRYRYGYMLVSKCRTLNQKYYFDKCSDDISEEMKWHVILMSFLRFNAWHLDATCLARLVLELFWRRPMILAVSLEPTTFRLLSGSSDNCVTKAITVLEMSCL